MRKEQVSLSSLEEAQNNTIVNQYQPSGIREQFQLSKTARNASILTTILFFPFILWIPALVLSFRSQAHYEKGEYEVAEKYARYALALCVLCAVIGVTGYIILGVFIPYIVRYNRPNSIMGY